MKTKEHYIKKFEEMIEELSTKVDELKVQASLGKAEAKDEFERHITELKDKLNEAGRKLEELREAGENIWGELRFGLDDTLGDMKETLKKVVDKIKLS